MPRKIYATAILIAVFLTFGQTHAQTTTNDWPRLSSVESGTKLSIKLKSGKSLEGSFNSLSESSLTLIVKNRSQELKRDQIQTIHRVLKNSTTKATLIGTGLGAGAGAVTGIVAGGNDSDFDKLDKAATAAVTVVGAGVGAITGYVIGRRGAKRELIYEVR